MIKNLVFDVGMVLIDFRYKQAIASLTDNEKTRAEITAATVEGEYWDELDRGVMTTEQVVDAMVSLSPANEANIRELIYNVMADYMPPYDYADGWLKGWHDAGYGVYILSNFSDILYNANSERFTFRRHTDGETVSYRHKVMKPDARLYEILCETYNLKPEECVFIDDRKKNIDGAAACGFATVLFTSYDDAQRQLKELTGR